MTLVTYPPEADLVPADILCEDAVRGFQAASVS
jgi:hypothetical protein